MKVNLWKKLIFSTFPFPFHVIINKHQESSGRNVIAQVLPWFEFFTPNLCNKFHYSQQIGFCEFVVTVVTGLRYCIHFFGSRDIFNLIFK